MWGGAWPASEQARVLEVGARSCAVAQDGQAPAGGWPRDVEQVAVVGGVAAEGELSLVEAGQDDVFELQALGGLDARQQDAVLRLHGLLAAFALDHRAEEGREEIRGGHV